MVTREELNGRGVGGLEAGIHQIRRGVTSGCRLCVLVEKNITSLLTFEDSTVLKTVVREISAAGLARLAEVIPWCPFHGVHSMLKALVRGMEI